MNSQAITKNSQVQLSLDGQARIRSSELTNERRLQALQIARECMALLKNRFGARRVILFGSLAGQGTWHSRSDIDLAVEGLAPADFFPAYSACCKLLPPELELELDLAPLEDAPPELRARILGEVEMFDDPILSLKNLIEDELTSLERVVEATEVALDSLSNPPSQFELNGLAAYLHQFYTAIETMFERIVINFGEGLPRGAVWHSELLIQVATLQTGIRPAVIDNPLRSRLEEYLRFRHFFRHAYAYTLEWNRLQWLLKQMRSTLTMLREQLQTFFDALS